jgi:hypothetical protein
LIKASNNHISKYHNEAQTEIIVNILYSKMCMNPTFSSFSRLLSFSFALWDKWVT